MVAFNFNRKFKDQIRLGAKRSTIRSKRRCNLGDAMQLYTGQRTKKCEKIMDVECIGLARIRIGFEEDGHLIPWAIESGYEGTPLVFKRLHRQEGFQNINEMVAFFQDRYGLPYTGWIHTWV